MLENTLDYQKKLHIERLDELIDKVTKLPKGTLPEDDDAYQIAGYLAMVKERIQLMVRREDGMSAKPFKRKSVSATELSKMKHHDLYLKDCGEWIFIIRAFDSDIVNYWGWEKSRILSTALHSDDPGEAVLAEYWLEKDVRLAEEVPQWDWDWNGLKLVEVDDKETKVNEDV